MLDRIEHHENPCITVPSTAALDAGFKARDERKLAAVRAARDRQRVCACGKPFVREVLGTDKICLLYTSRCV